MKNVVANKVLKSKASSANLNKNTSGNRDTAKLSMTSLQEEGCHLLARESSKLSQKSTNEEETFKRDQTRLSQKSTHSISENGSCVPCNPSNKLPQTCSDDFTDLAAIEDGQSKNSSVDSGTGSFSHHDTQSGSGSHKQLPNNRLVQNPRNVKQTAGDVGNPQAKQNQKKLETKPPPQSPHSKVEQNRSAGSTSVNGIELTQVDDSNV